MVILITGISSGFGLAMAKRLHEAGHTVYGTVRREVEQIEGIHYLRADVRDADAVNKAVADVIAAEGHIDVLINNAGMGISGPVEFNTEEEIQLQMNTNFMGQVRFTKAVLPYMRKAQHGRIICFSSIGGKMGLPFQGYYSASKFAIEGFCEALRIEVRRHHIDVVVVEPGDFATGFTAARRKAEVGKEVLEAYPSLNSAVASFENDENHGLKPEHLAKAVEKIVSCRRPRCSYVVSTFVQRLSLFVKTILPQRWYSAVLGWYYKV